MFIVEVRYRQSVSMSARGWLAKRGESKGKLIYRVGH